MKVYSRSVRPLFVGISTALVIALLLGSLAVAQTPTTGAVNQSANLRSGPGTTYPVVGAARPGQTVTIVDTSASGDWYQLADDQWIAAFLVDVKTTVLVPTATRAALTDQPLAAATPLAAIADVTANRNANLRAGPGTNYAIVGTVQSGQTLTQTGRNGDGSWIQLQDGAWIAAFLVSTFAGWPAPAAAPTTSPVVPTVAPQTIGGNEYVLVQKWLWDPYENGGALDGPSVHCGYGRRLVVNVLDANGNRVNGVAVQVQYGARETEVTGAQGRGDGVAEFVLGGGQDVKVIREASGRPVTSDLATGLSTNPQSIPFDFLISSQYCQDEATCRHFAETNSCNGHFSWTVTFQRAAN